MAKMKPYISELDNGTQENRNKFMDIIGKDYKNEIKAFENTLLAGLGDKLNIGRYLGGLNL